MSKWMYRCLVYPGSGSCLSKLSRSRLRRSRFDIYQFLPPFCYLRCWSALQVYAQLYNEVFSAKDEVAAVHGSSQESKTGLGVAVDDEVLVEDDDGSNHNTLDNASANDEHGTYSTYVHFIYIPRPNFELLFLSNALISALNSCFSIKYYKYDIMEVCNLLVTAHSSAYYCLVLYYLTLSNKHVHT